MSMSETRLIAVMALLFTLLATVFILPARAADESVCPEAWERYEAIADQIDIGAPDHVVLMYKYTFCPTRLEAKLGETITWVNVDKRTSHSFWFADQGEPESDRLFPEEFGSFTLNAVGETRYLCGPHWERDEMIGIVSVTE